ncbi:MAG: aspartate kinase [Burkholderiales bacterium]|nr:aspartate kinase [Burkholderiales bacterium]
MWVVKIGGSLNDDPLLRDWLALFAELGGGRVTLVCGGGEYAEEVRRAQRRWRFDDLAAHNMAVLAMMQSAYQAQGIEPRLQLATSQAEIRRVLHGGGTALWLPAEWLRDEAGPHTNWDNSGDSIALELARRLNAEYMALVKSCEVDARATATELVAAGVVDRRFVELAAGAGFSIELVQRTDITRMRSLLLGQDRRAGA